MSWKEFFKPNKYKIIILILLIIIWFIGTQYLLPSTMNVMDGGPSTYEPMYYVYYPIMVILSLPVTIFQFSGLGYITLIPLIPWHSIISPLIVFPLELIWLHIISCLITKIFKK